MLKWAFIDAYRKSSASYAKLRQATGEPDPFRIQYRDQLRKLIFTIIVSGFPRAAAGTAIGATATTIVENDQTRFIEAAQTELLALHEGNFARYHVTPLQFKTWKNCNYPMKQAGAFKGGATMPVPELPIPFANVCIARSIELKLANLVNQQYENSTIPVVNKAGSTMV